MSETHFDEYEHYNFTEENKIHSNHSGRLRTKKVSFFLCCLFVMLDLVRDGIVIMAYCFVGG